MEGREIEGREREIERERAIYEPPLSVDIPNIETALTPHEK
jgi:hypothetical protein